MVFQGSFMIFHGFGLVSMVFQGSFMVFMVFGWFPWFFKVVLWFFMIIGWFPWFFKVVSWFFMVFCWFTGVCWNDRGCTGPNWAVQVVIVVRMISLDNMNFENIWFSWSKPSNYQERMRCHAPDGRTYGQRKVEN